MMVNNSTNINNYLELSPQIIGHKKGHYISTWISGHGLRQAQKCGRFKLVKGIPTLSLLIMNLQ